MRLREILTTAALLLAPAAAEAHPHQWVDVASEVLFDAEGRIAAVRHHWRFDEGFSAFALQGLDADGDGAYSPEELEPLAQENVESLGDYDFFTFISAGDYKAGFGAPRDYHLDLDGAQLTLHFTLPLAQPLKYGGTILLQVYDPEYYIAFALPGREAVRMVDAPETCRLQVFPAKSPDAAAAAALATIGPEQRQLPPEMQELAAGIDNSAEIACGGPALAGADAGGASGEPQTAGEALAQLAAPGAPGGDLSALPTEPQTRSAAAEPAPTPPQAGAPGGLMARIGTLQASFNEQLNAALKRLKTDGSAFWWLGGFSFLYGIVHAAGPGHGKVVISSYLVANEQRVRRGVAIAFLSALAQALVAVGIVGLLAVVLNMTSMAITRSAGLLETGSFALVAGLGLYLLVSKGRSGWATARGGDSHAGHRHVHAHHERHDTGAIVWHDPGGAGTPTCSCGHHHHAAPEALEKPGLAGAAAAVLSVGLRPCTGAIVVLVFALAQGIFWAGIASTFLMALGTAITVAALASLAVGAKDLALRLTRGDDRRAGQVMLALELAAALFITALGTLLFVGSLAA